MACGTSSCPRSSGLSLLDYAPLAELSGWSPELAPEAMNCAAPDTGNMEVLHLVGTDEQKQAVARPAAGGRDPVRLRDDRAGRRLLGRAQHRDVDPPRRRRLRRSTAASGGRPVRPTPAARCSSSWAAPTRTPTPYRQQSMVLVPMDAPGRDAGAVAAGVRLPRPARPRRDRPRRRRACRRRNLLGEEGDGFAIAQARLGPGRVHHCMRADRHGRAGPARSWSSGPGRGRPSAGRWPSTAWSRPRWPRRGWRSSRPGCWCSRPPG